MSKLTTLKYLFYPRSIAIVGASSTPGRVGYIMVNNLLECRYPGKLYPINPNIDETFGIKAYPSIEAVPDDIDLVMIAVRPQIIPDIIERCGAKKVKVAIVHTAGFSEGGREGKRLEEEVVKSARRNGIRVLGPNTQGVISVDTNLMAVSANFPALSQERGIAYICQSGHFWGDWIFRHQGTGIIKGVDLGNMCDLSHNDFLEDFGDDPKVRLIVLHIEQVRDGNRFFKLASRISKRKPLIALKGGRTETGAKAVASHSGALAGNDIIYDTAFKQAGIIRAEDTDELIDFTKTFAYLQPFPVGNRVAIVTSSGAVGALAADACEEFGMRVAQLSQDTVERVRQVLPAWASISNPIDLLQSLEIDQKQAHDITLQALFADPNVDAIVINAIMTAVTEAYNIFDVLIKYVRQGLKKPVVLTGIRDEKGCQQWSILDKEGITTYPSIRRAIKSLAAAYSRYCYLNSRSND